MKTNLSKKDYIKIYTYMLEIRRFEERAAQLYGMGKIGGFCHLYIGQAAVVVGVLMTIDYVKPLIFDLDSDYMRYQVTSDEYIVFSIKLAITAQFPD